MGIGVTLILHRQIFSRVGMAQYNPYKYITLDFQETSICFITLFVRFVALKTPMIVHQLGPSLFFLNCQL